MLTVLVLWQIVNLFLINSKSQLFFVPAPMTLKPQLIQLSQLKFTCAIDVDSDNSNLLFKWRWATRRLWKAQKKNHSHSLPFSISFVWIAKNHNCVSWYIWKCVTCVIEWNFFCFLFREAVSYKTKLLSGYPLKNPSVSHGGGTTLCESLNNVPLRLLTQEIKFQTHTHTHNGCTIWLYVRCYLEFIM